MLSKEAREYFGLDKVAKESTHLQDFVAGVDPTGVSTFRNALENEENHAVHKAVGNTGGFVGGALMGAAVPAALTGALSFAMKKKNPALAKEMSIMAKGSLDAYNPKKMVRYLKSMKSLPELKQTGKAVGNAAKDVIDDTEKIRSRITRDSSGRIKINTRPTKSLKNDLKNVSDKYDKLSRAEKTFANVSKRMSDTYYNGLPTDEGLSRSMSALSAAGMAGLTGALNAGSANLQYNTALKEKEKMNKQASEEKNIVTKDDMLEMARAVHEINRHYNKLLMNREDPSWDKLSDEDKNRRTELLSETIPDLRGISAKKMHDMWVAQQHKEGWKFGDKYDKKKKTHPCIVSWKDLPDLEKAKDAMYLAVIKTMAENHFGIDTLMQRKGTVKEVKVPGGDKILMKKAGFREDVQRPGSLYKEKLEKLRKRKGLDQDGNIVGEEKVAGKYNKMVDVASPSSKYQYVDKAYDQLREIEYGHDIYDDDDGILDAGISKKVYDATGLHRAWEDDSTALFVDKPGSANGVEVGDYDKEIWSVMNDRMKDIVNKKLSDPDNVQLKHLNDAIERTEKSHDKVVANASGAGILLGATSGITIPVAQAIKNKNPKHLLKIPLTAPLYALPGGIGGIAAGSVVGNGVAGARSLVIGDKRKVTKDFSDADARNLGELKRKAMQHAEQEIIKKYNLREL